MGSLLSIPPVVSAVPSSAFVAVSPHVHVPSPTAASSCISVSASVAPSVVGSSVPNRVRAVPDPEIPPPPSFCEVNVAPSTVRCLSCVPDLYVCPAHLVACGGVPFICCSFCLKVLCFHHMYCPCAAAVARRAWVSSLPPPSISVSFHQPGAVTAVSSPIPVAATTSIHVPAVSPSSIPVPGVLRSPVPAVVSGSLARDSDDCRDFVVFVFSDDSFSDLSNNNNDCDGP